MRLLVRLSAGALPGNNSGQVVHTHVPLSPSSIIQYQWSKCSDTLWLVWWKVMVAYHRIYDTVTCVLRSGSAWDSTLVSSMGYIYLYLY